MRCGGGGGEMDLCLCDPGHRRVSTCEMPRLVSGPPCVTSVEQCCHIADHFTVPR